MLEKLAEKWDDFYRRYLSLNRGNWKNYLRIYPYAELGMKHVGHPIFGSLLRRLYRFEGEGTYTQSHIMPIGCLFSSIAANKRPL